MTPRVQFSAYRDAFNRRDVHEALRLFADRAIFEMPLLGQRLFGIPEITAGHRRIFEVTESAQIEVAAVRESGPLAIAEGRLHAKLYRDERPVSIPLAMVLEAQERINRVSTYLDARPYRLWADGTLFASAGSSQP